MDYTNLYEFQTSSGIIVPDDSSVLYGIQKKFQEIFGTDIDLSAETPVGRLIEAYAVIVKSTLGVTAQNANQFNINEATGVYLDAIASIYDLVRIGATKTKIQVKCFFEDGPSGSYRIPAGSYVLCTTNGALFQTDAEIVNDSTMIDEERGRPYAIGSATALKAGVVVAPAGTVTSIQSAVVGWVGVTNISPTYTGTDVETDEAFRKRIRASRPNGVGFDSHLVSTLNRLDGVYSNCILENNTSGVVVKKGVEIPPHSIYIGVDCIETSELLGTIAKEIATAKPVGTGMVNYEIAEVTRYMIPVNYGYNNVSAQEIYFYKAKKVPIKVSLTYALGNYTGDNIINDIARVTAEFMDTIGVGGIVYGSMLAGTLMDVLNIRVNTVLLQKAISSSLPADTIVDMKGYESPYADAGDIEAVEKNF